jgi:hypothetical protein
MRTYSDVFVLRAHVLHTGQVEVMAHANMGTSEYVHASEYVRTRAYTDVACFVYAIFVLRSTPPPPLLVLLFMVEFEVIFFVLRIAEGVLVLLMLRYQTPTTTPQARHADVRMPTSSCRRWRRRTRSRAQAREQAPACARLLLGSKAIR